MKRAIVAFGRDAAGDWVAELGCGHAQHVRHAPPLSERPWVLTPEGRHARLGTELDCVRCDRGEIPEHYEPYRQTPAFDERSVPAALLERHATKPGIWARIVVSRGALDYHVDAPFDRSERLTPQRSGIVAPEVQHHVEPRGAVSFHVEFWRAAKRAV